MLELFPGYCIDTSALIDLWRKLYPPDVFSSLWGEIGSLVHKKELISPKEVLRELSVKDDELLVWVKTHDIRKMFKAIDREQQNSVSNILSSFQGLIDPNAIVGADPFVIALAMSRGWSVITSERPANPGSRPKIPDVCRSYSIKCIGLLEFFREKNWNF